MKKITIELTESDFTRLTKKKEEDPEWRGRSISAYLSHLNRDALKTVNLKETFNEAVTRTTGEKLAHLWFSNFILNAAKGWFMDPNKWMSNLKEQLREKGESYWIETRQNPMVPKLMEEEQSIAAYPRAEGEPCILVAAGPSIRKYGHIDMLAKSGWRHPIIACDRMLRPLLEAGVGPENGFKLYVASVDGNRIHIPKFFSGLKADGVKGMFCTTVAPMTIEEAIKAGVEVKWFHGAFDQWTLQSLSRAMNWMVNAPSIAAGGNVGATTWTLGLYLWCNPLVFVGLDLGYHEDTPVEETAYFSELDPTPIRAMLNTFEEGFNPDFGVKYKQDLAFKGYKDNLLDMVEFREMEVLKRKGEPGMYPTTTINATEGGALHGPLIKGMRLQEVLEKYG